MSTNAKDKYFCEELNRKHLNEGEDTVFFVGSHNGQCNLPPCLEVSTTAPENGWLLQSLTSGICKFFEKWCLHTSTNGLPRFTLDGRAQRDKKSSNDEKYQKSTEWHVLNR